LDEIKDAFMKLARVRIGSNAPCQKAARNEAVYRRPDGIILIDPVKARGQKQIVTACPYRVIEWNEEKQVGQKCTLCAHMLDKGEKEPRCVEACCTGALIFGIDDKIRRLAQKRNAEIMNPEYGLKTRVFYIGLPKRFVAGTVVSPNMNDALENVTQVFEGINTEALARRRDAGQDGCRPAALVASQEGRQHSCRTPRSTRAISSQTL
jgi:NAD-dependent dihydropyrimidine dehydrogenase PreA subunit